GMKNPVFRKIVGTYHYEIPTTNKQDARPYITNSNKLISTYNNKYKYENAIGIKTGYTSVAKNCLVGGAAKDGIELISVVLAVEGESMYPDTIALFDYGFANFKKLELLKQNKVVTTVEIENGDRKLNLLSSEDYSLVVSPDEIDEIEKTKNIKINDSIKAPVKKGDVIGTVSYTVDGKEQKIINLVAEEDVKSTRIIDITLEFLKKVAWWQILIVVILLFLIWRTIVTINRTKRRRRAMYLTKRRYF
ncbi:MAG: D-alanyl-D-alanine carboxypeptidase, partial [Clostridia bacterium]|nr:D-alanyl-D-alanine carboxypeptidase [Clostridia bacterium]